MDLAASEAVVETSFWISRIGREQEQQCRSIFAIGPCSNTSVACRMSSLLHSLLQGAHQEVVSTLYKDLGLALSAGNCNNVTLDMGSALGAALLIGGFGSCLQTATELTSWLQCLSSRIKQVCMAIAVGQNRCVWLLQ